MQAVGRQPQRVLSLPSPLRLLLAAQPKLVTPALQVVHRVISRYGQRGWLVRLSAEVDMAGFMESAEQMARWRGITPRLPLAHPQRTSVKSEQLPT